MNNQFPRLITGAAAVAVSAVGVMLYAGAPGGDLAKQQPKYHIDVVPPAPVLSAEQELKTFKLPSGFRIELLAAEPAVEEPIALAFDADGHIYVDELRGYMPDIAGNGELDPVGRVVRLDSSKEDGKYDKSTVFLDNLVAPRSVGVAGDGVIVAEPPDVWFCRDTTGSGKCDQKKPIANDFGGRSPDPEHKANGLVWSLDNWYYSANYAGRFRYVKGEFLKDGTISRGQWGIAQDDTGRLYFNTNGSFLRADSVPAQYMTRNPYLSSPAGVNAAIAANATFPCRVNPGVNRGYTPDLDLQGKLQRVTASCGPTVYRGDRFPAEFEGNAFACEPAGNLVARFLISQEGVALKAKSVQHDGIDFLTSTDERFRPVNLYTAPDGSLLVVDLYHGILQHKAYMSAYLTDQVKKRDLDKNEGHRGRIWRIVSESGKPATQWPHLSKAPAAELVKDLSHPNGWWRDTAQRLLVERSEKASVALLRQTITDSTPAVTPLGKVHALWALQGMDKVDDDVTVAALKDPDPRVRVAALRTVEVLVRKKSAPDTTAELPALARDPDPMVQLQVLIMASPDLPDVQAAANQVLAKHLDDPIFRAAAINGATGRELELLQSLLTDPAFGQASSSKSESAGEHEIFSEAAECIVRSRSAERIEKLLDLISHGKAKSSQEPMLAGMADALVPNAKSKVAPRRLRLLREPPALAALLESSDKKVAELAKKAESVMSWPGKPGDTTPPLKPLSEEQQKRFAAGHDLFGQICGQCHQPSGLGAEGIAPPLVDSEWALGPDERVVRIVLNGLHGPITVGKKTVELEMPGLHVMSDEQLASILTYVRREWGHEGEPVDPQTIAKVRQETTDRGDVQWTAEELMQVGGTEKGHPSKKPAH
jgi:mono/diheme cytochrome c family protein/glucose/arabinose dehydrogenase